MGKILQLQSSRLDDLSPFRDSHAVIIILFRNLSYGHGPLPLLVIFPYGHKLLKF